MTQSNKFRMQWCNFSLINLSFQSFPMCWIVYSCNCMIVLFMRFIFSSFFFCQCYDVLKFSSLLHAAKLLHCPHALMLRLLSRKLSRFMLTDQYISAWLLVYNHVFHKLLIYSWPRKCIGSIFIQLLALRCTPAVSFAASCGWRDIDGCQSCYQIFM